MSEVQQQREYLFRCVDCVSKEGQEDRGVVRISRIEIEPSRVDVSTIYQCALGRSCVVPRPYAQAEEKFGLSSS